MQKYEQDLQDMAEAYETRLSAFVSREKSGKSKNHFAQPPSSPVTWEDVLQQVEDSRTAWENKAKGKGGFIRQEARNFGHHARMASHWLNMLPAGDYGSIVCGGLKLLFGVGDN